MTPPNPDELSSASMLELFRAETETQTAILTTGLLELERGDIDAQGFELLMRAAHSLKGAARIVNLPLAVLVAHGLEDCFVAASERKLDLRQEADLLFRGVDLLAQLARRTEANLLAWETEHAPEISEFLGLLEQLKETRGAPTPTGPAARETRRRAADSRPGPASEATVGERGEGFPAGWEPLLPTAAEARRLEESTRGLAIRKTESPERVLRLTAENLNRLLALAGESLVESRWLRPFADSFQRLKRHQMDLRQQLERLRLALGEDRLPDRAKASLSEFSRQLADAQQFLTERMQELEMFDRRAAHLAQRLYLEVLRTRMRPFSDGVRRFPRMVRDLARSLGKEVKLEISGETTPVDRDILERLETPLAHLLRNAVDHGCEPLAARMSAGKPPECSLHVEARHSAGVLLVTVSDDGAGVDLEQVRRVLVQRSLAAAAAAEKLSESELLEFLFRPGFTLKEAVTEISGRGFGLDVVQNMVKSVRGAIRLNNQPGRGLRVQLQLPLTLSVVRALLVQIGGEPYAIPLSQITRTLKLPRSSVSALSGRDHFQLAGQQVGLLSAHEVLDCGQPGVSDPELHVVVLSDRAARYGLVVDRFLGERELVVQPLDARLGKVQNISSAALMEDGTPALIVDVDDILHSVQKLIAAGRAPAGQRSQLGSAAGRPKRVLAVDDSSTVRELERKVLLGHGYLADVAVDGMEAWNALRSNDYDLVITDVEMPRLDGIALATLIKKDPRLKQLPVLILSYKDREEDRLRGLEAGADYYLTKGSFHEESLLRAVVDLIGEPVT
ncbi:MAG TPA: hybrid sensor histidine kinase/response regulator [Candidatus Acidoferrum sp.]|nr:hybrid sensor histidine kinase/response regulator [Candidatus Acidoferrum sp.]